MDERGSWRRERARGGERVGGGRERKGTKYIK